MDAGDKTALVNIQGSGPADKFSVLGCYPQPDRTGQNSTAVALNRSSAVIDTMITGNSIGGLVNVADEDSSLRLNYARYEPSNHQSEPFAVFGLTGRCPVSIGCIELVKSQGANHIYALYSDANGGPANKFLGPVRNRSESFTLTGNLVNVGADTYDVSGTVESPVVTTATSGQVTNNSGGTLTQPVSCLGDLSTVS